MSVPASASPTELSDFAEDDQDEVRALILSGLGMHWGQIDETLNRDLDDIASAYRHGRTVVVRLPMSTRIVATGSVVPRDEATAEIVRMSVEAGERRRGLGRSVVEELVRTAASWGASNVVLETSADWQGVVAFYRSCGFTVTHAEVGERGRDLWFRRPC